jgi:hypothetical protein
MKRVALMLALAAAPCGAYSALSHEAVIDAAWLSHIRPTLLARFPGATPEQIREAHGYAYGGSQIQDMGYFPFASHLFSDLAHYVRSGDFVAAMIRDSQTMDEYAFALGALSHYFADRFGHPAVNRSEPLEYPKVRRKYGNYVTYEDNPTDHIKTEFAFDVIQVSHKLYAPDDFRNFIGFEVAEPLLERAFQDTYGIPMKSIFGDLDLGIGTYRWTVGKVIPEMTKVAWDSKRDDIERLSPHITRSRFVYAMPRRDYQRLWDRRYRKPGIFTRMLAFFFRLIPTVGPFRFLSFRPVPAKAETDFLHSFDVTVAQYQAALEEIRRGRVQLTNYNLDTGEPVRPGVYRLADQTYAHLVDRLARAHFAAVPAATRADIVAYFGRADRSKFSKKTLAEVEELKERQPDSAGGFRP